MTSRLRKWASLALGALCVLVLTPVVQANTPQIPYHVGRLWMNPDFDPAEGWGSLVQYPGGIAKASWDAGTMIWRGWVAHAQKGAGYMFSLNWTDPEGIVHPYASSYFFRSMNYDFPPAWIPGTQGAVGFQYLYGGSPQQIYRWPRPEISVVTTDGESMVKFHPGVDSVTILPDHPGVGGYTFPITQADLVVEYELETWWTYIQGVRLFRKMYAYPFGSPHQDYVVQDMTLTNEGVSNRQTRDGGPLQVDENVLLPNNNLQKVLMAQGFDYRNTSAAANQVGKDTEGMFIEPWGAGKNSAILLWDGDDEGLDGSNPGPDYADPSEDEFFEGHLVGNGAVIYGPVFVSTGPGADYDVALDDQPGFRTIHFERCLDFAGKDYSPSTPQEQREFLADGISQMPIDQDYRDYDLTKDIAVSSTGPTVVLGYGPRGAVVTPGTASDADVHGWDLAPDDAVRIVQVMAMGGIEREEGRRIGNLWNTRKQAGAAEATWMDEDDQVLAQSGVDTAKKAAALAWWNYHGSFAANVTADMKTDWGIGDMVDVKPAAYAQQYNVPDAPRPPAAIRVSPVDGSGIIVQWTKEAEAEGDFDTGTFDLVGYRVYRQDASRLAPAVLVAEGPFNWFADGDPVAVGEGAVSTPARYFRDSGVTPAVDYWYAVTAYDDGSQNWARPGKALESGRWWTWTGYSVAGVTGPSTVATGVAAAVPGKFALEQNVPNPFNPSTTIRFSVPTAEQVTLSIYAPNGQLVRTLVDGTVQAGVHELVWNGVDQTGRPAASGVYVYRLNGEQRTITKRMVLVR